MPARCEKSAIAGYLIRRKQLSKTAEPLRARLFVNCCFGCRLVIHAAHAARWHRRSFFLFRNLRHECFGGEQQARDGRGVLQRRARDLGWIDNARLHQIGVLVIGDVVTFVAFALLHFLNNERAFAASVVGKLTRRLFNRTTDNRHTDFFIGFEVLDVVERLLRPEECDTAAWDDAFLNRCTRGVQRAFYSFISVSVAAPTLMTATPPASFASRSCSFSRS